MRLYFLFDLTGNLIRIEKLVLGRIWIEDIKGRIWTGDIKICYLLYLFIYFLLLVQNKNYNSNIKQTNGKNRMEI